jgi:uncharacterized protein Yka (UPF0111/DUF47 family)
LDREDIHELAHRLDDVIDFMDGACGRMSAFKVSEIPQFAPPVCRHSEAQIAEIGLLVAS